MKKFTDFIVNKRYLILFIFIILVIISAIFSSKVNINYDITKYLPNTSETRIGIDIMEKEFEETESSFNLMFKGLDDGQKNEVYKYLTQINGVESVDYDETEEHNKDDYTLYGINVSDLEDSELATNVYNEITKHYEDYEIYTSGAISDRNSSVLPAWIMIVAIGCALVILIIMCESYIEPFLFLTAILMAVLLNNGTNIIFDSVSNITSSISAILQMALSMDYSIMLMNRYKQEKEKEKDKVKAMKNALYNAFKSISSSSITTIVGLVVLVFMSFTIGRDLGFVLAKGVLFSLISIFFVLPSLILIFDKAITKTTKKAPNIKLNKLGKISYKIRYPALFLFVGAFIISYLLKGNLGILYTEGENDKISEIFPENNQIAIIYKNEDEGKVGKYLSSIENNGKVDEVLGYSNTINEELKYNELKEKLNDLGAEVEVEDYLLKIIYYNYYNQDETNKMTFDEFVEFIQNDIYKNENISEQLDNKTRKEIDRLANFTNTNLINKKRTSNDIANILEIDKEKIDDVLIYYNSKHNTNIRISVNEFIKFMNKDVLINEKYSKNIDSSTKSSLDKLSKFTNLNTIKTKMNYKQMASLFGINEESMKNLYLYYMSVNKIDTKLTLSEFSNFVINDVLSNSTYAKLFDETAVANIKMLSTFSNTNIINKNMNSQEISNLFEIDNSLVNQLLLLKYSNAESGSVLSISEFINNVMDIKNNTTYLNGVDLSSIEKLSIFARNKNNINTTKMNKHALSNIFDNISVNLVENIYMFAELPAEYEMTPQEFVNIVINTIANNQNVSDSVDTNTVNSLKLLKMVIDDSIKPGTKYSATNLAKILNVAPSKMYQLYALNDFVKGNTNSWKATPHEFVNLILNNINNENIKNNINEVTFGKLNLVSKIMESAIKNTSYTYNELSNLIGIDSSSVKNIYLLYVSNKKMTKLTPQEFVNFVLQHKNDKMLASSITSNTINDLRLVQSVMNGVQANKKYTSKELSDLLGIDKGSIDLLYGLYYSKYVNPNQTISLKEFVVFLLNDVITNPDYSSNFNEDSKSKLKTINGIMNSSLNDIEYTKDEMFAIITNLTDDLDKNMVDLLFVYYGSEKQYNEDWTLTVEKFVNYLNENILTDVRFEDFIEENMRKEIVSSKETIKDAKKLLVGENYSRIVINTKFDAESEETFNFIQKLKDDLSNETSEMYIVGDSPMAYEMSKTFQGELDFITVLTMIAIFIVVVCTFKSLIIPLILVFMIQCAVYVIMGILSFSGEQVYFISLLIVQSILMGATIDYAILYTSYYLEGRKELNIKDSIINAYNNSINTILTSASILVIVTLIIGNFASAIAAKICKTISQGTLCSALLILLLLPGVLAACDKIIVRKK